MSRIIVAGGGHGGIAAASLLAKKGHDVTVFEKRPEKDLGYDWTDIFDPKAFREIDMPMMPITQFEYKENMTFYSRNELTGLRQQIPPEKLEIKVERRDLYRHIIKYAKENGVKFRFECEALAPLTAGSRVIGVKTAQADEYADLIIDACGLDSPIKKKLPASCGINPATGNNNQFYVYRAFYDRVGSDEVRDKYKVCLFGEGILGIAWIATEPEYTDLLIGRFAPFSIEEANRAAEYYRKNNPQLGRTLKRGGQFVKIPVRQPLSKLVCDGYAAIGDCAYMTVPIIGSGIANSFRAARMLADTVADDADGAYTEQSLWKYQVRYYSRLGAGFAVLACVKEALTVFTPDELDYLFDSGVITASDLSIDADTKTVFDILHGNTFATYKKKVTEVVKDPVLLKKMMRVGAKISAVAAVCAAMPRLWSKARVGAWVRAYETIINKF